MLMLLVVDLVYRGPGLSPVGMVVPALLSHSLESAVCLLYQSGDLRRSIFKL